MFDFSDLPYFRLRESEERQATRRALSNAAARVHATLADHYADRIWALEQQAWRRKLARG